MILIVDDDSTILTSLRVLLRRAGYESASASSPDEAVNLFRSSRPELVLMDMNYSRSTTGTEGLELLAKLKVFHPRVPVILMTAWGSIELAVAGMRAGAFDFVTKPWDPRRLLERIANALELSKGASEPTPEAFDRSGIVGASSSMTGVLAMAERVAPTSAPVLITGESGTGKELVAEAIHRNSRRRDAPFVKVNLGGISQSLFESEMFGYHKGAFTGAVADRVGRFEAADGGTIFLDEIGDLDAASQVKMLRVLQEQAFEPLGTSRTKHVDVRVICATNADLPALVAERRFREDLYYRINIVSIELPPLRQRGSDIALLARHFLAEFGRQNPRLGSMTIADDAGQYLSELPFPGNVRELKNLVERTALLAGVSVLGADEFRRFAGQPPAVSTGALGGVEQQHIARALAQAGGNVSQAAAALGISRQALYRRMAKYGL
ncbi:MAG: sigma-54 dependent transcriptional regulator [Muribaculaceae bacterium]|nr:sigma-54 dependent transcriptional regulator [Muribaculaceae bacterium]